MDDGTGVPDEWILTLAVSTVPHCILSWALPPIWNDLEFEGKNYIVDMKRRLAGNLRRTGPRRYSLVQGRNLPTARPLGGLQRLQKWSIVAPEPRRERVSKLSI
ncbi:hypothetical protein ETB97_003873 [Aspergillus alliaceus]|uniref:Uncharacterized protein n=1 Tax=Petromyces alliaceus TaxID=209559 RepID=A0A8H6E569_PETAA|nr:hypothetical protein ETB97_003873 [Aspergillus burnettii]